MNALSKLAAAAALTGLALGSSAPAWAHGVEGSRHLDKPTQVAQADPASAPVAAAAKKAKSDGKKKMDHSVPTVKSAERARPK